MTPPGAWSAAVRAATEILSGFWCEPGRHDRLLGVPWLQLAATAAYLSGINCASTVMSMQNQIKVNARSTSYAPHMSLPWNGGPPLKYVNHSMLNLNPNRFRDCSYLGRRVFWVRARIPEPTKRGYMLRDCSVVARPHHYFTHKLPCTGALWICAHQNTLDYPNS
jgi:hypothetical protein